MTSQEKSFIEGCITGQLKDVRDCVERGVNPNVEDSWGIGVAAEQGHSKIVRYLLENGVSHDQAASRRILAYAVHNKDLSLLEHLIVSSDAYKVDRAAASWAAANGDNASLGLVLPYIQNLGAPYCTAAGHGHIHSLKFMNDNQVYENEGSGIDRALNWAALSKKWSTVTFLIDSGVVGIETLSESLKEKYDLWLLTSAK